MTLDDLRGLFRRFREFGIRYLALNADGEMFLRRDILDILRGARDAGLVYSVNTNGTLFTEKKAREYVACGPAVTTIGLDAATEEGYLRTRGLPGGLDRVRDAVRWMQEAGHRQITLGAVILRQNVEELAGIARLGLELGVRSVRFTAYHEGHFDTHRAGPTGADEAYLERLREVIGELLRFKKEHGLIRNSLAYLRRIPEYLRSGKYFPVRCYAGFLRMEVDPRGDVWPCTFLKGGAALGNVRRESLEGIWGGEIARRTRLDMLHGRCPTCWLSCYAEENLRFSPRFAVQTNLEALQRLGGVV